MFTARRVGTLEPFGPDGRADTCYRPESMAPAHPDDCPIPDLAVIWEASPVTRIRVGAQTGVRLSAGDVPGATGLAIHLAPSDNRTDGTTANPLIVEVGFADGRTVTIPFTGDEAPLRDRATKDATGVYTIATLRLQKGEAEAESILRRLAQEGVEMIEATRETGALRKRKYRLRAETLKALGAAVRYHRRTVDQIDRTVLAHLREYGKITNRTLQNLFDIDIYRARDILADLQQGELIVRTSEAQRGPGVEYGPGPKLPKTRRR